MKLTPNADGTHPLKTHHRSWRHLAWRPFIERLRRSDAPILVGPWRGEIGFEALYWTAFVEKVIEEYKIDRARMIPISRGGAAIWYGCPKGVELYAMRTPQQVRVQTRVEVTLTGSFKQASVTDFDRGILRDAAETLKLGKRYHVLHPAWMYHRLAQFWTGHRGVEWVGKRLRFQTIGVPALPEGLTLPEQFVAVRFYARPTFPVHKLVNQFVGASLEELSSKYDVVLLDHNLYLDDHDDLTLNVSGPRVHHLSQLCKLTPETNLTISSAVLGRALGFVGTYGGFGQLALRMCKPSVTYFLDWGHFTAIAHRNLADALSIRSGIPAMVLKLNELAMLQSVMPIVQMAMPKPSQFTVAKGPQPS